MIAALFLRGPFKWRSRQLSLTLIWPPANHWACGSFQTSTLFQRLNQCSDSACSPQKPSGSSSARCQSFSYSAVLLTWAAAANSGGGGKVRFSVSRLVICEPAGEDLAFPRG